MSTLGRRDVAARVLPLHAELVRCLEGLTESEWLLPTVAGKWRVREVAAHLIDVQLRAISSLRDDHLPPIENPPPGGRGLVRFLDQLNATWIEASRRLSSRILLELLQEVGPRAAAVYEGLDPDAPAHFPVAWAGETTSQNWMHVGREYTELWHHQMQIRDATDRVGGFLDDLWFEPLLDFSVRALPPMYRSVVVEPGERIDLHVDGHSWSLVRLATDWQIERGTSPDPRTRVSMSRDTAWRLLYNALSPAEARRRIEVDGDDPLVEPLLDTRSVMV